MTTFMNKTRIALLTVLLSSIQLIQAQITISIQPAIQVTNLVTGLWAPLGGIPNSGENVLIPVVASGSGTLTYQWQINGSNLVEGTNYIGTQTTALSIPGINPNAQGIYTVIIGNGAISITSAPVPLSVQAPIAVYPWASHDLQAQFSTNGAPSGTSPPGWQYCEGLAFDSESAISPGGLPLPSFVSGNLDPNWNELDFGAGQPGWDGNVPGYWAGWAQRVNNGTLGGTLNGNKDATVGQIIGYRNSAVFVVPSDLAPGVANLSGGIWNLRHFGRSGTWRIFHNDGNVTSPLPTPLTQGTIQDTSGDSDGPCSFDEGSNGPAALVNIPYAPGDTFRIDCDEDDFVGWRFTVFLSSASDPGLTVAPQSQIVPAGSTVTLTATAVGTAPFTYQWQLFGTNLPGATTNSLVLPSAQTNQSGPYAIIVHNSKGSFTSDAANIEVYSGVYVASQPTAFQVSNAATGVWVPASSGIFNSGEIVFSTAAAGGNGPFTYQWQLNGTNVANQTNATLMFAAAPNLAGSYTVVVGNGSTNTAASQPVVLAVYPAIPVFPGTAFDLEAQFSTSGAPSGTSPTGWQYCEGLAFDNENGITPAGEPLPAFISGTLDTNYDPGDFGNGQPAWDGNEPGWWAAWAQRVDNGTIDNTPNGDKDVLPGMIIGYQNSAVWVVPSNMPPGVANIAGGIWNLRHWGNTGTWRIWYNDHNQTPFPTPLTQGTVQDTGGDSDGPMSFDQGIAGAPPLRNISFRPGDTFRIDSDENDFVGWQFTVYVNTNIGLTLLPQSLLTTVGSTVELTSAAVGAGPITYQWQFFGTNLPGATNSSLILANAQTNQSGDYDVVASNPLGSIQSPVATVTVVAGVIFTAQPSAFQVTNAATGVWQPAGGLASGTFNSGELVFSSGAVAFGTGPFSYQWQLNGTNVPGFTNADLLFSASTNMAGTYVLVVSDGPHSVSSQPLPLAVYPPIPVFPGYAADLQAGFSTNGPVTAYGTTASGWIYCESLTYDFYANFSPGGVPLISFDSGTLDPNWNSGDFGNGQPGWDGNVPGTWAGWAQRVNNGTIDNTPSPDKDALPGMIMSACSSAVYVVPPNFPPGTANLAGGVWNLCHRGNTGSWRVFHNDNNAISAIPLTDGVLQDEAGDSDGPLSLDLGSGGAPVLRNIPYQPGDTFRIDTFLYDYAGWQFTVYLSPALPKLSLVGPTAGNLTINWTATGVLQTSTNVAGPYVDVATTTNSYTFQTTNTQQFFRVKVN
jgi:hypothetical protein